jgi:hypothetical protein
VPDGADRHAEQQDGGDAEIDDRGGAVDLQQRRRAVGAGRRHARLTRLARLAGVGLDGEQVRQRDPTGHAGEDAAHRFNPT